MKKSNKILSFVMAFVMVCSVSTIVPLTVTAAETNANDTASPVNNDYYYSSNYYYRIQDDGTACIIGYDGNGGALTIPSEIDGYTVTAIGSAAFSCHPDITAVTLPDTIKSIGERAFQSCTGLRSFYLPASVTQMSDDVLCGCRNIIDIKVANDNPVFDSRDNCNAIIETSTNTLTEGCKATVIPDTVTAIDEAAFCNCSDLALINIPDSVTSIGTSAFAGCSSLEKIVIPGSVKEIGKRAFADCTDMETAIIGSGVQKIDYQAFFNCPKVTKVIVPGSVTSISDQAFGYYKTSDSIEKLANFTLLGYSGSAAQKYCDNNQFTFLPLDD